MLLPWAVCVFLYGQAEMVDSFGPKRRHEEIAQTLFPSPEECIFITACTQNELFERCRLFFLFIYPLTNLSAHSARIWSLKGELGKRHWLRAQNACQCPCGTRLGVPPAANQEWEIKATATTTVNISTDSVLGRYLCYLTKEPCYSYLTSLERLVIYSKWEKPVLCFIYTSFNLN